MGSYLRHTLIPFFAVLLLLLVLPRCALANEASPSEATLKALYKAAKAFKIDATDLIRIAYVESRFDEHASRLNKNGTIDFGMFQINSVHWTTTCVSYDVFTLQGNAMCAAKLVKLAKKHQDKDTLWLGRYHSKTPSLKAKYHSKLMKVAIR